MPNLPTGKSKTFWVAVIHLLSRPLAPVRKTKRSLQLIDLRPAVSSGPSATRQSVCATVLPPAACQSRIKPQFLLQITNQIRALLPVEPVRAERLLADLAIYLSGCAGDSRGLTQLSAELAAARAYLHLAMALLGGRLQVLYQIDETLDVPIPACSILPLVENAIDHGIAGRPHGGVIRLTVRSSAPDVVITVDDNGVGIPPAELAKLQSGTFPPGGLRDLQQRLLIYAGQGLDILSITEQGTIVTLRVPL